jgi:hypothetical protein
MTEVNNLFQNGYAGGVKSEVSNVQLQQCSENDISDFKLQIKSSLNSDAATIDYQTRASLGPGNYNIDNMYGCDCSLEKAREVQLSQPSVNFNGGKGWMGENGCLIDTDSDLRFEVSTNKKYINQLDAGMNVGFFGRGPHDVDTESKIRDSLIVSEDRPCNVLSGVSTYDLNVTPMIDKLRNEIQNTQNIIPEDNLDTWIRGGLPSRQIARNQEYISRWQSAKAEN